MFSQTSAFLKGCCTTASQREKKYVKRRHSRQKTVSAATWIVPKHKALKLCTCNSE